MEDLVESILDYIRSDYTDYAVMLNGEWGSGKTHFWNNKIKKKIESMQLNGKRYTTIYMSLYGISNLEEISKKIFMETTQLMDKNLRRFMNSKGQETIPEYAKTGIDMANFFGVTQNGNKLDYAEFFATDDKVLCFDDLERANVDVIDILGYINNFVEHDHIKTIIICNEKELATKLKSSNLEMKTFIATYLLDKQNELNKSDKPMVEKIQDKIEHVFDKANDYERIKEKLIGETFEYAPKFDYIINGILIRYEDDPDLERFYRTNINLIISTFKKSGTRNLRILKHALKDFQKIYQVVTQKYPDISNRVIQTMLIFTIAISFEIKAGKVTKDKFIDIKNNEEYKAILVSSRVLMDNRQFYIKEFDNNYYYNFKAEYRFFKFIEYYVRTRIFDMKILKNDMAEIQNTGENRNVPAYKRLLTEEYWKIPDEEFLKVINDIIKEIKSGKVELIELVKLYSYFSYFSSKKLIPYESETIKKIFEDSELQEDSVIRKFRITAADGKSYSTNHYSLEMIIAVGFKVNSERAVQFRKWVNQIAKDYTIKGWVMDDERLKRGTYLTEKYFDEQLERIREIRASERKFYQKITDLYATAIDYDKNSATTRRFYATVQNKMHYAVHGHTAAELIVERADHTREHMGLTTWADAPEGKIKKSDVTVAKNYLSQDEMKQLNRMVTAYLDFAENMTLRHIPLTMQDWEKRLNSFIEMFDYGILQDAGKVSAEIAKIHAETEFEKYRVIQDRLFMSDFDKYMLELEENAKK